MLKKTLRLTLALVLLILFGISIFLVLSKQNSFSNHQNRLGSERQLELEGKAFFKAGEYEKALEKFNAANDPKFYIYQDHANGYAEAYIEQIHEIHGEYEKALAIVETNLAKGYIAEMLKDENEWGAHLMQDQKFGYEALIKARDTNNNQPVFDHMEYFKKRHAKLLPPESYQSPTTSLVARILRLYDLIGDYDAGIAYIDMCMDFFKQQDIKKYGEYRPGRADEKYLKVREGFEKDKAEAVPGCLHAPKGQACVGRATQAMIQSDYFSW